MLHKYFCSDSIVYAKLFLYCLHALCITLCESAVYEKRVILEGFFRTLGSRSL